MKKCYITGFYAILILGFLLTGGCTSTTPPDTTSPTTSIPAIKTTLIPTTTIPVTTPVTNPEPTIRDIIPDEGTAGSTIFITDLDGNNFQSGATVTLMKRGYPNITATNVNVWSSTRITCTISLPSYTNSGSWDIVVTNPDGLSGISANLFIIRGLPRPKETITSAGGISVTGIDPRFAASSNSTVDILVFGSNFQNEVTAKLNRSGKADIFAYRTHVLDITRTQVRCYFNLPYDSRGIWNIILTNPDGSTGILENAFEVRI
jgi:hypothetical protein